MKVWMSYLKKNKAWLCFIIALLILQQLYLRLLEIPRSERLYLLCICIFVIIIFLSIQFMQYVFRYHKLTQAASGYKNGNSDLPAPEDLSEECYQNMVENINNDRHEIWDLMQKNRQDMYDYYSVWIHQIKTPVAALNLLLQVQKDHILQGSENDAEFMENVNDMEEEVFQIEQYVNMALQIQKVNSPQSDFVIKEHELDTIIREAIHKYAKLMIRRKLTILYQGTDAFVLTDEKWCEFIIEQILSNSVKYSTGGTISIEVKKTGNWLNLCIRDEGIGISAEDLPRVFEKGYSGYNGHSDKRSTGIGLYICKRAADKLGHTIRIESEKGKGTSVFLGFSQKKRDVRD